MATTAENMMTTMPTKVEDFLMQHLPTKSEISIKPVEVEVDLGNLAVFDINEIKSSSKHKNEAVFLQLTTENVQLLINKLYELPSEKVDNITVVKLPEPITRLPREKKVPQPRQPTKWEKYAALKGIPKKKKGRMIWDSETKQYRPRFGYKSKGTQKDWLLEVPERADPLEDQFAKKKKEKQERIAKNDLQRMRNIARNTKSKVPGVGLTPVDAPSKDTLSKALAVTYKSTASLGKFMQTLPKEKLKGFGKKRKFDSNFTKDDIERQKKIAKNIADGVPVINTNKAANNTIFKEQEERAENRKDRGKGKKGRHQKPGFKGKPQKPGFTGKPQKPGFKGKHQKPGFKKDKGHGKKSPKDSKTGKKGNSNRR